jgi:DNA-directed RNA polymerase sigma subunit (sigma70/sigma32)
MDEAVETEDGDALSLHELLAAPAEDPAQQAARELDWSELMEDMDERDLALLRTTINGESLDLLARQFGVSAPRITQIKREIGEQIRLRWGDHRARGRHAGTGLGRVNPCVASKAGMPLYTRTCSVGNLIQHQPSEARP